MATDLALVSVARNALKFPRPGSAPTPTQIAGVMNGRDQHGQELFLNHVWESLNAVAKILFFAVATPVMLTAWGKEHFGLFAVANSCVALMACFDLGLRMLTRVSLTNPQLCETAKHRLHALNFAAFVIAAGSGVAIVVLLSAAGYWHRLLHLPRIGDFVIAITATLTIAMMSLQLLVERLAAAGHLSRIKAALFAGNVLAFAVVIGLLHRGAGVATVTTAYFAALLLPLFFLLPMAHLQPRNFLRALIQLRSTDIVSALRAGGWINVITASWVFQTYALVLLISWVMGPAAAGTFFLFLKLADLLGVLGASASEPTVAALARSTLPSDRHRHFATAYKSAIALCLTGVVGYTFFSHDLFRLWLHRSLDHAFTGFLIGLFGVAIGFSRMVTSAGVGLSNARPAALGLLAGAVTVAGATTVLNGYGGPELILLLDCGAALLLVPAARVIARDLRLDFAEIWLRPIARFASSLIIIIAICLIAAKIDNVVSEAVAGLISSAICARHIFRASSESSHIQPNKSRLGYDTRSWRSAFVMKGVDLMNPFRQPEKFTWTGPCVISSTAGLGDLFIHLPLIAGIANEARRRGIEVQVALRRAHAGVGEACGWNVQHFDNALEDFFKRPSTLKPSTLIRSICKARRHRSNLWIDLTGNAVSALAIKSAGARKVAARITRGGRSLVNYPLPHTIRESEYDNIFRVAAHIGCELDRSVFDKLLVEQSRETTDAVVLCVTTASRWKNWPLVNFLQLIDRFPMSRFVVTGFKSEILAEEKPLLAEVLARPNVLNRFDTPNVMHLVGLIGHARAVITNDTSAAHIANAFEKPGAVLFGPVSPEIFATPNGLRIFVDRSCPFHPCVQWTCRNQENWCMRKIPVEPVAAHLATVLEATATYAATAILAGAVPAIESSRPSHCSR